MKVGDRVALHQALDPHDPLSHGLRDETGVVVRVERSNGVDGAVVQRDERLPHWVAAHHLHVVDPETYHRWRVNHRAARWWLVATSPLGPSATIPDLSTRQHDEALRKAAWADYAWDRVTSTWAQLGLRSAHKRMTVVELPEHRSPPAQQAPEQLDLFDLSA